MRTAMMNATTSSGRSVATQHDRNRNQKNATHSAYPMLLRPLSMLRRRSLVSKSAIAPQSTTGGA